MSARAGPPRLPAAAPVRAPARARPRSTAAPTMRRLSVASRAGSARRDLGRDLDRDLVDHLERAEQCAVGLDPPAGLLDDGAPGERAVGSDRQLEADRLAVARELELAGDVIAPA